jgi:hypothetical protein
VKKIITIIMVSAFMLLLSSTLCLAQSPESWAIGKWRGFEDWSKSSWILEIAKQPDGKLSGSFMFISEKSKMYPISINFNGNTLTFQNSNKEEFVIKRISDYRMDGKYTNIKSGEKKLRFWKEGETKFSSFLGYREGTWEENNLEAGLEVLFIDENAMSSIYYTKTGWGYVNGELTTERTYIVQQPKPEYQFSFLFKKGDEQIDARVLYNGRTTNRATFTKTQKTAKFPSPAPVQEKKQEPVTESTSKKEPIAVSDILISEYQWLVGSWIGVIEKEKETRSLEISLAKEGMKAKYGVTGKEMGYTKLEISGGNIFFETGAKSKVNLHKVSNSQMEGTFETSNGRTTKATFVKNDTSASQQLPESISAFLGTWEGFWGGQLGSKLVVEKINTKEAACIYIWENSPDEAFKGGQDRVTAIVDEKKSTIQWGRSTKYTFTMSKDLRTIDGSRESPGDVSTIKMKKVK